MSHKGKVPEGPSFIYQTNLTNHEQLSNKSNFENAYHNRKGVVFVNPKKLSSNQLNDVQQIKLQVDAPSKDTLRNNLVKVYINPNFKKPHLPTIHSEQKAHSCNEINTTQREYMQNSNCRKYSQGSKSVSTEKLAVRSQQNQNCDVPKEEQTCSDLNKSCKIFINPNYTRPSNVDSQIKNLCTQNSKLINTNHKSGSLQDLYSERGSDNAKMISNLLTMTQVLRTNLKKYSSKKRIMLQSKLKTAKELPLEERNKDKIVKPTNTIFLNPKFKSRIMKGFCSDDQDKLHSKPIPIHTTQRSSSSLEQHSSTQTASSTPMLDYSNRCLQVVQPIKQVQRKRSVSTSLVAVSATKLIRKKKPSQRFETNLNAPVFLSKTKLVRSSPSKCLKNILMEKTKVKRVLPKAQLQLLTPNVINKLRKQSFTTSITNLVNVVTDCASVTKIRSRNGKSLRLVRKKDELKKTFTESSSVKGLKSKEIQSQKNILKHQLRKNAFCTKKKLRVRFSKINVDKIKGKNAFPPNTSKYVYKSNEFTKKQTQMKSTCNTKKVCLTPNKSKITNYISEKYKYKFIRKQSCKSSNKYEISRKDVKNTTENSAIPIKSIRKWKVQNSGTKSNYIRKQLSIVNIGGIFYRCSRTKLTRNKSPSNKVSQVTHKPRIKGLLLNISGQRFQLENNGQTLRCLDSTPGRKRIDIGGVTFVTTSSGSSLIRTNYHTARSIVMQAKQKSLSQLTKKHKKSNEPCPFYHRLGRCFGKECGFCVRLHDPKYIAVCKKFVQGVCEDPQCLLSHNFSCHNMPTCQHFLAGHCGRDNCPYPHIKVCDNAPICLDFLRGFCTQGDQCVKRHLEICPSFEKGVCPRGKYCPYPHPKSKSQLQLKGKFKHLKMKVQPTRDLELVSSSSLRYFEDVNLQKEKDDLQSEDVEETGVCVSEGEEKVNPLKKRPRLGRLPSFIPLTLDNSCNYSEDCISEKTKL